MNWSRQLAYPSKLCSFLGAQCVDCMRPGLCSRRKRSKPGLSSLRECETHEDQVEFVTRVGYVARASTSCYRHDDSMATFPGVGNVLS